MSVAVGFSPAATGLVSQTPTDAAKSGASGGSDLFATLLALLGANISQANTGIDPSALTQPVATAADGLAPVLTLDQIAAASKVTGSDGKSLMASLTDALTALSDELDAGKTPDAAEKDKLGDLVDALAGLLGAIPPALAAPTAADTDPTAAATAAALPIDGTSGTPLAAETDTPTPTAAADTPADPALAKFADLLEKLGDKLAGASPELSKKLQDLAGKLDGKGLSADLLTSLGVSKDVAGDIERLAQRLDAPKSPAAAQTQPAALTTPSLQSPDLGGSTSSAAPPASSTDSTSSTTKTSIDIAQPVATKSDDKPATAEKKPEPAPAADPSGAKATDTAQKADDAAVAANANTAQQPATPTAQTRIVQAAYQSGTAQINIPQVAFELAHHIEAGSKRFQIRLDPPELGRIDVKLDVDKTGAVTARMTVERSETLDLMQRDQRFLQQALQQAGLDTSRTSLEFSLKQNPFSGGGFAGSGQGGGTSGGLAGSSSGGDSETDALATTPSLPYRGTASASGVNLFV